MGECGCGELNAKKVVQLGEAIIAIEIYPGCQYCSETLGLAIHVFDKETADSWALKPTKTIEPDEYGNQIVIPIMDANLLVMKPELYEDFQHYGDIKDWMADNGLLLLQSILCD